MKFTALVLTSLSLAADASKVYSGKTLQGHLDKVDKHSFLKKAQKLGTNAGRKLQSTNSIQFMACVALESDYADDRYQDNRYYEDATKINGMLFCRCVIPLLFLFYSQQCMCPMPFLSLSLPPPTTDYLQSP